ncbi:MAG: hypothetical protein AAB731_00890 [Patescibacteria group bacterium]
MKNYSRKTNKNLTRYRTPSLFRATVKIRQAAPKASFFSRWQKKK